MRILDNECLVHIDGDLNKCIPWFLLSSYASSEMKEPILTEEFHKRLGRKILKNWDTMDHRYKRYLNRDELFDGKHTGDYPDKIDFALKQIHSIYSTEGVYK